MMGVIDQLIDFYTKVRAEIYEKLYSDPSRTTFLFGMYEAYGDVITNLKYYKKNNTFI